MQSRSKPLDDLTNLLTNAAGAAKGIGDEIRAVGRSQAEKLIAEMDLISRDEFEVLKSRVDQLQVENASLKARIEALEG